MENIMDWQLANCRNKDPRLFFPPDDTFKSRRQIELAKGICGRCDLRDPCLKAALENDEPGIWGGTTRRERTGETDPWDPWEERWTPQFTKAPRAISDGIVYMTSRPIDPDAFTGLIEGGFPW